MNGGQRNLLVLMIVNWKNKGEKERRKEGGFYKNNHWLIVGKRRRISSTKLDIWNREIQCENIQVTTIDT